MKEQLTYQKANPDGSVEAVHQWATGRQTLVFESPLAASKFAEARKAELIQFPTPADKAAVAGLVWRHTGGTGNVETLSGPRHSGNRAQILTVLTGKKVSKADAGINKLRAALQTYFRVPTGCDAAMNADLQTAIKQHLEIPE